MFKYNIQKEVFLLKDIFTKEKSSKRKTNKHSIYKSEEKEKDVNKFGGLYERKLDKDYLDKLTTLLYNSRNKKDYSKKRRNIKRAIYKLDENEKLYLTLPKLKITKDNTKGFSDKQEIKSTNYTKTETTQYTNTNNKLLSTQKDNYNNYYNKEEDPLNENIKEVLYEQDNIDKYEEEKGKFLYEKLKTRYNNFDLNNSKDSNSYNKSGRKNWSQVRKRNIPPDYQLIATPQQISEFDYNLGQAFIKGKFRFLTNKQKEHLGYIGELNLFNSINRIKEKQNIIKEMKNEKRGKKILLPIDVFKYDAEKWKKYTYEKNKNNNDVVINELNEKNKVKLDDMKEYIDKLNLEAYSADKDVTNIINNIDIFLDKYGSENNANVTRKNSRMSDYSMKSLKNKKKEKDNKSFKEDDKKEDLKLNLQLD